MSFINDDELSNITFGSNVSNSKVGSCADRNKHENNKLKIQNNRSRGARIVEAMNNKPPDSSKITINKKGWLGKFSAPELIFEDENTNLSSSLNILTNKVDTGTINLRRADDNASVDSNASFGIRRHSSFLSSSQDGIFSSSQNKQLSSRAHIQPSTSLFMAVKTSASSYQPSQLQNSNNQRQYLTQESVSKRYLDHSSISKAPSNNMSSSDTKVSPQRSYTTDNQSNSNLQLFPTVRRNASLVKAHNITNTSNSLTSSSIINHSVSNFPHSIPNNTTEAVLDRQSSSSSSSRSSSHSHISNRNSNSNSVQPMIQSQNQSLGSTLPNSLPLSWSSYLRNSTAHSQGTLPLPVLPLPLPVQDVGAVPSPSVGPQNPIMETLQTSALPATGTATTMTTSASLPVQMEPVLEDMCHSTGGRVASIIITPDNSFIIVGYYTGYIILYDLTVSGNKDDEDRLGFTLGKLKDSNGLGSALQVKLALGGWGVDPGSCSHVFAGARLGCSQMLVFDLASLRSSRRKRGFISLLGNDMKIFQKTDAAIRGFTSLSTLSSTVHLTGITSRHTESELREYSVRYRLLTGRGFGVFHIWNVALSAMRDPSSSSSSSNKMIYNEEWSVLLTGSVGAPQLVYGCFVTARPVDLLPPSPPPPEIELLSEHSTTSTTTTCNTVSRGHQICVTSSESSVKRVLAEGSASEVLLCGQNKPIKSVPIDMDCTDSKKTKETIKGDMDCFHTTSSNGSILFGGIDELIISTYLPRTGHQSLATAPLVNTMITTTIFPLTGRSTSSSSSSSSNMNHGKKDKRSRHFRSIAAVSCTDDGVYAMMLCSDNCILLYSPCDVTGEGSVASRQEGRVAADASEGYVAVWSQLDPDLEVHLSIEYAMTQTPLYCNCSGEQGGDCYKKHRCPSEVTVCVSFTSIAKSHRGGAMRTVRLAKRVEDTSNRSHLLQVTAFSPTHICVGGPALMKAPSSSEGRYCRVCGDTERIHWSADLTDQDEDEDDDEEEEEEGKGEEEVALVQSSSRNASNVGLAPGKPVAGVRARKLRNSIENEMDQEAVVAEGAMDDGDKEDVDGDAERTSDDEEFTPAAATAVPAAAARRTGRKRGPSRISNSTATTTSTTTAAAASQAIPMRRNSNASARGASAKPKPKAQTVTDTYIRYNTTSDTTAITNMSASATTATSSVTTQPPQKPLPDYDKVNLKFFTAYNQKLVNEKQSLLKQIVAMKTELKEKDTEARLHARKSDRQIEQVLQESLKHQWEAAERNSKLTQAAILIQCLRQENEDEKKRHQRLLEEVLRGGGGGYVSATNEYSSNIMASPEKPTTNNNNPVLHFCVACQAYSADTIILPCGHLCLCNEHVGVMSERNQLALCPVCKMEVTGVCRVKG